jgi:hypothetical protein
MMVQSEVLKAEGSRKPIETASEAAKVVAWASKAAQNYALYGVVSELEFVHTYLSRTPAVATDEGVVEWVANALYDARKCQEERATDWKDLARAAISAMAHRP